MAEDLANQLKLLEAKKTRIFSRLQSFYDNRKSLEAKAKLRAGKRQAAEVDELRALYQEAIDEINRIELELNSDYIPNYQPLNAFDDMYFVIMECLDEDEDGQSGRNAELSKAPLDARCKLPKIELMDFNGDPMKWPFFCENFRHMVHENPAIDPISKFHYLLGKLKGEALSVCAGITPSASNYRVLWDALVQKYEDKRELAGTYLNLILDSKPLTQENAGVLGDFIQKIEGAVRSLRQLQLKDLGDYILTSVCLAKVDVQTRLLFERSLSKNEFPTFDKFADFIKEQCKILKRTMSKSAKPSGHAARAIPMKSFAVSNKIPTPAPRKGSCALCKSVLHRLHKCPKFLEMSQTDRKKFVFKHTLCFNCLRAGHLGSACPSSFLCSQCKAKHHTLLHSSDVQGESGKEEREAGEAPIILVSTTESPKRRETMLLSTATVLARSRSGENLRMRVLVDSGSQCNFITSNFCRQLRLPVDPVATSITGIGATVKAVKGQVTLSFKSKFQPEEYRIKAWVIDRITDDIPNVEVDPQLYALLEGQQLADDHLSQPRGVDGIIGAELAPRLLGVGKSLGPGWPMVIESPLGIIVMGKAPARTKAGGLYSFCCTSLHELVQKFWELENLEEARPVDPEEAVCERLFRESCQRSPEGRYTVALPFERYPPDLGESYSTALRRLLALEKKFSRSPDYREKYCEAMQDYIDQGHMELVAPAAKQPSYYIPHHGILKASSTSTPLRVVFDASATTLNGRSLNDTMYTGPKLQLELFDILVRFRTFEVGMTADVKQMYRQIGICKQHRPFQRLLWRFNPEEPVRVYEMTTVTFGVKASPFLALRTVQQLASDEAKRFPLAAARVARELYMDDVVSSVPSGPEAVELYRQWVDLFRAGGFQLRKWATNSPALLKEIPPDHRKGGVVDFPIDVLTVLGLQWCPEQDELRWKVAVLESPCSKRAVLSTIARIWDPLGLLTPVTVTAKVLMQRLWEFKVGWDDPLPSEIWQKWQSFLQELPELENFRIRRYVGVKASTRTSLIGFADASEKAYAAVLYLWMDDGGDQRAQVLCAKSKVAPMKRVSIPRLELCAAVLLARLMKATLRIYEGYLQIQNTYAFSDSTVVLHWLQGAPNRWKTFVANRVAKIQTSLPDTPWLHVRSEENPADCASRGLSPRQLLDHPFWVPGPGWLKGPPDTWPRSCPRLDIEGAELEEQPARTLVVTTARESPLQQLIQRCSAWTKLLKVIIIILRFGGRLPRGETFKASDYEAAETKLIKFVQQAHFADLVDALSKEKHMEKRFRVLRPFLRDGIVRVGGRLQNAPLRTEQQHPILLPKGDKATALLVDMMHLKYLHAGPTLLAGLLRQKYWILGARDLIRRQLHRCNVCFRCKPQMKPPLMADLPLPRVSEVKPFCHTGIDFAGPFKIKLSRTRGAKTTKGYLCLFICLSTRAVHLEAASDLSMDVCLDAVRRFLARRGPCSVLYSDQGTNFVGAKRRLDELGQFLTSRPFNQRLQEELSAQRIEWKLNPPSAPHFGGSWEAGVKAVKYHFTRVIGEQSLTFEEFSTILCEIEAVLNSRPLCWLSTDPAEPTALTPAHFLTFTPLNVLPAPEVTAPMNRLQRWELLSKMVQDYWTRWRWEYLSTLQKRLKWDTPSCPVKPGTLVLVHRDHEPPLRWPMGRIEEVYPGPDGVVRVALIRIRGGLLKRPVHKLAPLPNQ